MVGYKWYQRSGGYWLLILILMVKKIKQLKGYQIDIKLSRWIYLIQETYIKRMNTMIINKIYIK